MHLPNHVPRESAGSLALRSAPAYRLIPRTGHTRRIRTALHDARRTSATTGADAGIPEHVMQKRLGHADARTTREVYTHVLPESERKAAEMMEAILRHDAA
jgi:integrase